MHGNALAILALFYALAVPDVLYALPALRYVWAALSAVGVAANGYTFSHSVRDERWVLANSSNVAKRIIATQSMREQGGLLFVQLAFFFIRFWTLFWPIPNDLSRDDVRPWVAVVLRNWGVDATLLTLVQVFLVVLAILGSRSRVKATAVLAAQYPTPKSFRSQ